MISNLIDYAASLAGALVVFFLFLVLASLIVWAWDSIR